MDISACAVLWQQVPGFQVDPYVVDAGDGLLRFTATPEETAAWSVGTHQTSWQFRDADGHVYVSKVAVQVYPPAGVSPIPDPYDHRGPQGSVVIEDLEFFFKGTEGGGAGSPGSDGEDGWAPILAVVTDTDRRVLQVVGWTGGTGTPPATGDFIGPVGLVATAAAAVDIRGAQGIPGAGSTPDSFTTVVVKGTALVADSPTDTLNVVEGTGILLTPVAGTDSYTIANAGVVSATAGTGINVSSPTGSPVISNTGVTSVNGNTGAVATPNAFGTVVAGGTTLGADSTSDTLTMVAGTAMQIVGNAGTDTATFNNTGVTSATAGPGISLSAATGAVAITALGPSKSYAYVSSTPQTTSSTSIVALAGQSIVVPAGSRVEIHAELILSLANSNNGLYYGFHLTQGGVLVPDGPDVSWGSYKIEGHVNSSFTYSGANYAFYRGGYLGVAAANVDYQANLAQLFAEPAGDPFMTAKCTLANNGVGNLTVQMFVSAEVGGSAITAEKGSSFVAHVISP